MGRQGRQWPGQVGLALPSRAYLGMDMETTRTALPVSSSTPHNPYQWPKHEQRDLVSIVALLPTTAMHAGGKDEKLNLAGPKCHVGM